MTLLSTLLKFIFNQEKQ